MSKLIFNRQKASELLSEIAQLLPDDYRVLLICDNNNETTYVTLGDLDLDRAEQVINRAMVEDRVIPELSTPAPTETAEACKGIGLKPGGEA